MSVRVCTSVCVMINMCRSENNLRLPFPQWAKKMAKHRTSPFPPQNRGKDVQEARLSWDLNSALHDDLASILNYSAISVDCFVLKDKLIPKCLWNWKGPRIAKMNLWKKTEIGRLIILYFKAPVNEVVWCWHMNRHADQRDRMETSEWAHFATKWFLTRVTTQKWKKSADKRHWDEAGQQLGRPDTKHWDKANHRTPEESVRILAEHTKTT